MVFDYEVYVLQALGMVMNIREAFKSQVHAVDWMDETTRNVAGEKADAMIELIGYPDWFSNVTALDNYYSQVSFSFWYFRWINICILYLKTLEAVHYHQQNSENI